MSTVKSPRVMVVLGKRENYEAGKVFSRGDAWSRKRKCLDGGCSIAEASKEPGFYTGSALTNMEERFIPRSDGKVQPLVTPVVHS